MFWTGRRSLGEITFRIDLHGARLRGQRLLDVEFSGALTYFVTTEDCESSSDDAQVRQLAMQARRMPNLASRMSSFVGSVPSLRKAYIICSSDIYLCFRFTDAATEFMTITAQKTHQVTVQLLPTALIQPR
jgi:hypothetical protein